MTILSMLKEMMRKLFLCSSTGSPVTQIVLETTNSSSDYSKLDLPLSA